MDKSLAYILNPDKTEDMLFSSSINCTTDAKTAYLQMKTVYQQYERRSYDESMSLQGKTSVKAIHYIMSFADRELEQTQEYFALSTKAELTSSEKLKMTICKQSMESNDVKSPTDVDSLSERVTSLGKKISALKDNLESCKNLFDVYSDIAKTYDEISKGDYIGRLVEEERQRKEYRDRKRKKSL